MSADPRDEAERLVAAALAALSVAARSTTGFATGSAECCVCPLCKAIAAARDPDPEFAERLAGGVGDLATGLAGLLRAFGTAAKSGDRARDDGQDAGAPADEGGRATTPDDVWRSATQGTTQSSTEGTTTDDATRPAPKPMAKKAVKKKAEPEA